ncbi:MAG: GMC family oxidoreductase [Pseudomonadota bacterium]
MVPASSEAINGSSFDVVVVGSGFGSAFFVKQLLELTNAKVLILEWGSHHPHDWQIENHSNSAIPSGDTYRSNIDKSWNFTIALGGGTNCWFGQTPRFHPSDFKLKSRYGVGDDWPISYDELEPYYGAAEKIMSISGDPNMASEIPRSTEFPQPPHRPSSPDRVMMAAQPDKHFIMPTARSRVASDQRAACCASHRCWLCPADAKFTASNGLMDVFNHDRVTVCTGAEVMNFETSGNSIRSATFKSGGREMRVHGDLFVLGANGIQSPAILKRSSIDDGPVGQGLHECLGFDTEVMLNGIENFDGSTITTGINYSLYDGEHRRNAGGALLHFENRWSHGLRAEKGRLRETLPVTVVVEDLALPENRVELDGSGKAYVKFEAGRSDYAHAGLKRALDKLGQVLSPLPVEDIRHRQIRSTESHVQGTLKMGSDPEKSVTDSDLVHHRMRNLVVVGSSVFATCSAANPSLTVAALSLRAADRLFAPSQG